jgi:hypothetical protein
LITFQIPFEPILNTSDFHDHIHIFPFFQLCNICLNIPLKLLFFRIIKNIPLRGFFKKSLSLKHTPNVSFPLTFLFQKFQSQRYSSFPNPCKNSNIFWHSLTKFPVLGKQGCLLDAIRDFLFLEIFDEFALALRYPLEKFLVQILTFGQRAFYLHKKIFVVQEKFASGQVVEDVQEFLGLLVFHYFFELFFASEGGDMPR